MNKKVQLYPDLETSSAFEIGPKISSSRVTMLQLWLLDCPLNVLHRLTFMPTAFKCAGLEHQKSIGAFIKVMMRIGQVPDMMTEPKIKATAP